MRQQKRANVVCVQAKKKNNKDAGLFITGQILHIVMHLSPRCDLVSRARAICIHQERRHTLTAVRN